jgi:hypothetical protein
MPRVTGTTIETLRYNAGGLYTASAVVDAAGSTFECYAVNDGTNSGFAKVLKKSGTGAVLADLEVVPYGGMKIDGACIVQSGVDIHVYLVSHMPGAQSPEILTADKYVWRGVAAPYAAGEPQQGADGAYMPEEQGEVEVDVDAIAEAVVQRLIVEYGGPLRQVLEDKVKDAIGEGWDPDNYERDPRAQKIQDATRPWFRDAAYEAVKEYHEPAEEDN